jgi:hypothetical protein
MAGLLSRIRKLLRMKSKKVDPYIFDLSDESNIPKTSDRTTSGSTSGSVSIRSMSENNSVNQLIAESIRQVNFGMASAIQPLKSTGSKLEEIAALEASLTIRQSNQAATNIITPLQAPINPGSVSSSQEETQTNSHASILSLSSLSSRSTTDEAIDALVKHNENQDIPWATEDDIAEALFQTVVRPDQKSTATEMDHERAKKEIDEISDSNAAYNQSSQKELTMEEEIERAQVKAIEEESKKAALKAEKLAQVEKSLSSAEPLHEIEKEWSRKIDEFKKENKDNQAFDRDYQAGIDLAKNNDMKGAVEKFTSASAHMKKCLAEVEQYPSQFKGEYTRAGLPHLKGSIVEVEIRSLYDSLERNGIQAIEFLALAKVSAENVQQAADRTSAYTLQQEQAQAHVSGRGEGLENHEGQAPQIPLAADSTSFSSPASGASLAPSVTSNLPLASSPPSASDPPDLDDLLTRVLVQKEFDASFGGFFKRLFSSSESKTQVLLDWNKKAEGYRANHEQSGDNAQLMKAEHIETCIQDYLRNHSTVKIKYLMAISLQGYGDYAAARNEDITFTPLQTLSSEEIYQSTKKEFNASFGFFKFNFTANSKAQTLMEWKAKAALLREELGNLEPNKINDRENLVKNNQLIAIDRCIDEYLEKNKGVISAYTEAQQFAEKSAPGSRLSRPRSEVWLADPAAAVTRDSSKLSPQPRYVEEQVLPVFHPPRSSNKEPYDEGLDDQNISARPAFGEGVGEKKTSVRPTSRGSQISMDRLSAIFGEQRPMPVFRPSIGTAQKAQPPVSLQNDTNPLFTESNRSIPSSTAPAVSRGSSDEAGDMVANLKGSNSGEGSQPGASAPVSSASGNLTVPDELDNLLGQVGETSYSSTSSDLTELSASEAASMVAAFNDQQASLSPPLSPKDAPPLPPVPSSSQSPRASEDLLKGPGVSAGSAALVSQVERTGLFSGNSKGRTSRQPDESPVDVPDAQAKGSSGPGK